MATQKKQSLCFNNSGFSLSELLAVVSVFSILAAIAVPNINAQREVYRLNGAASGTEWTRPQNIQNNYPDITLSKRVVAGVTNLDPVFSPRGTAGAMTVINVTNPSGTRTVTVRVTGSVKID